LQALVSEAQAAVESFAKQVVAGDLSKAGELIAKTASGKLRSIRNGSLATNEADQLKAALTDYKVANAAAAQGGFRVILENPQGKRTIFKCRKDDSKKMVIFEMK
jgi:hypothetical protein